MFAAVISLLVVILLVLLLHMRCSMAVSHVLRPSRFHNFHTFSIDTSLSNSPTKGLDPSSISAILLFLYSSKEHNHGLDCVICLSPFEENEMGRELTHGGSRLENPFFFFFLSFFYYYYYFFNLELRVKLKFL
jgi:hypothetical protein